MLLSALSSAFPTSNSDELLAHTPQNDLRWSIHLPGDHSTDFIRDHSITTRTGIKITYSADGWKVRYTTTAITLPIHTASTRVQEFYTAIINQLPPTVAFDMMYAIPGRSITLGSNDFWLNLRSNASIIKREFVTEICAVLFEAAKESWAPVFKAEWMSLARDVVVYVSLLQGEIGEIPGPLSI